MVIINILLDAFPIVLYPFVNIIILILLGIGLTYYIIPKKLKPYLLWLSPWTTIITSILYFVIMSLFGLSVSQTFIPLVTVFSIIVIYVLKKYKPFEKFNLKENLILFLLVILTLILNLSPLIRQDKILTSVSMGNNDIIVYVNGGDYLKDHSIKEVYKTKVEQSIDTLIKGAYRWGTPIINAFFLKLLNLEGYQYTYISQTVLFSLFLPLIYIFFIVLFGRPSIIGLIISSIFTGFNANLLYIIYHDFFGQVLFWGIETLLFIFFFSYFGSSQIKLNKFNRYDFILGIVIAVLYYSYHEPAVFMFAPLAIFLIITFILKKSHFKQYFFALLRIASISIATGFIAIYNATLLDYKQVFMANPDQPIGWDLFRSKIPYANPFEAMGFWSIHNFEPLPIVLAVVFSAIVVFFIIKGIMKGKNKVLTISYLLIFLLFFYVTAFSMHNFFTYNRALTYTLPFFIVLFSIGLVHQFEKRKYFWSVVIVILISLELLSAVKLNKRFIKEHVSVGKQYISILELKEKKFKEPIYPESHLMNEVPLWMQMWPEHFLYSKGISVVPKLFYKDQFKNRVPDNSLVLISKPTPWYRPPEILLKNMIWENKYYKLGRLCNSEECLINSKKDMSVIGMGKSNYEDTLLINGWSVKEAESRWAAGKESTLRLVAKEAKTKLIIEALTFKEPQELSLYINDQFIGKQHIKTNWQEYSFNFDKPLAKGIHNLKFIYSNVYKPFDLGINPDKRELSVNFRRISID